MARHVLGWVVETRPSRGDGAPQSRHMSLRSETMPYSTKEPFFVRLSSPGTPGEVRVEGVMQLARCYMQPLPSLLSCTMPIIQYYYFRVVIAMTCLFQYPPPSIKSRLSQLPKMLNPDAKETIDCPYPIPPILPMPHAVQGNGNACPVLSCADLSVRPFICNP